MSTVLNDRSTTSAPVTLSSIVAGISPVGMVLAVFAAAWHVVLMTSATNDNFMHLTLAKQWLAGDWPVRDFFDQASILQYAVSAVAQAIGGDRLMSEAVVVGLAWAISAYLVFVLVRRLTGYSVVAVLAALLLIAAGARGYSYPKGLVYAVAAALWWQYVASPTNRRAATLGAWAAVAFYWRADHGVYVALSVPLACLAAHGLRVVSISRCAVAGGTMLALLAPFFLYVQVTLGLPEYIQTGVAAVQSEHATQGPHAWPVIRFGGIGLVIVPAESYAPVIGIRWGPESNADQRHQVLTRYDLTTIESGDEGIDRVRLSARSIANLRSMINEPVVADTAGIDRSTGTLPSSSWGTWQRWKFDHPWLRLQFLPALDGPAHASEVAVALFYLLPIAVIGTAFWLSRRLVGVNAAQLIAFAVFAFGVDAAMLRLPFPARMADAVTMSAILFGFCAGGMWRAAVESEPLRRSFWALGALTLILVTVMTVTVSGRFVDRVGEFVGRGSSLTQARTAWSAAYKELVASPPLSYFIDRPARFSLQLAAYVRECVPETDRVLVLWFEPEIYYYGDRLMAQRHLVFAPTWANVAHEQRLTLERLRHFAAPLALARRSALDGYARASYPGVVDYVQREYQLESTVNDDGEEYLIFARRDRPPLRGFSSHNWPCFVREPSVWSRVGQPVS